MAIGDILEFGTLRWYNDDGTYYDVKQYPSYYRSFPNYSSFTFVNTNDVSYKWKWIEAIVDGRKIFISKTIAFDFQTKVVNDISNNININGSTYALRFLKVEDFRALPDSVLRQIDFSLDYNENGNNRIFYVATSTILQNGKRVFIGRNSSGTLEEISKSEDEINALSSKLFWESNLGFLPILEEVKSPPVISGVDSDLGKKNSSFSISYSVKTADETDEVIITEKLNGNIIRTLKNPSQGYPLTFNVTEDLFKSLNMHVTNTIEIVATNNEATSYRRYTFIKTNSGPVITLTGEKDLGKLTSKPTIEYSVSDNEGDEVTITEFLNGNIIKTFTAVLGQKYSIELTDDFWIACNGKENTITISAEDSNKTTTYEYVTFSRKVDKIQFTTKYPIETSTAASKIMVTPQWDITNATGKVEACNNGFDNSPTWEDITSMVTACRPYVFINSTKTANKWGIKIRITITKNEGYTGEVAIYGFGGAYE